MKGVPFFNGRYRKGVPFLSKMVYKRVRVGPWGRASPYKTLLSGPPGGGGQALLEHSLAMLALMAIYSFV